MKKLVKYLFEKIQNAADAAFTKADNHRLTIDNNLSCDGESYKETTEYSALIFHIECNMALCRILDLLLYLKPNENGTR